MTKTILILTDGMADETIPELGGKTPVEYAETPHMDAIARDGACGTFLTLPAGYPTSSDVANMSVMGYAPAQFYTGRGPLEAVSQGIDLAPNDVAWRCNLINVDGDILTDYSGGHIETADARQLIADLGDVLNSEKITFHPGVSYRNLMITHGAEFTDDVAYEKPDSSQGKNIHDILLKPNGSSPAAAATVAFLNDLMLRSRSLLASHPINLERDVPANMSWLWSPGRRPDLPPFSEKYAGARGAIISAVDVIFGLGICAGMDVIKVPGATGFIDTNYEGKADAAAAALDDHDFIYLHVEAADECGHMGDLKLKMRAIEDIDARLIGRLRHNLKGRDVTYAVLPDHPVPVRLRLHTRDPVPFAICGPHIKPDACRIFSEREALSGDIGYLEGDQLMRRILNCP